MVEFFDLSRHLRGDAEGGDVFVDRSAHVLFDFVAVGVIHDGGSGRAIGGRGDGGDVAIGVPGVGVEVVVQQITGSVVGNAGRKRCVVLIVGSVIAGGAGPGQARSRRGLGQV